MFDELADLGGQATLHRLAGHVATGGHHSAVFDEGETINCIIRPWQSDIGRQGDSGYTGQTPGVKIYVDPEVNLGRDDRVVYDAGHFRLSNPQYDQFTHLERWDGRTDERRFRTEADIDPNHTITPPDRDGYGGR